MMTLATCRSLPAWRDSRSMDLTVAPALKHAATTASSHCRMVASASVETPIELQPSMLRLVTMNAEPTALTMISCAGLVGAMLCTAPEGHYHSSTWVASSMMTLVTCRSCRRDPCNITVAPALKHAATTASSHCRTMASASVETPIALQPSMLRLVTINAEPTAPTTISCAGLVGAMLCTAPEGHNLPSTWVASSMMALATCRRDPCSMDITVAPALEHAASTASSHCRTMAGACVETHTALQPSMLRLVTKTAEPTAPTMISCAGLVGAMLCTAPEGHYHSSTWVASSMMTLATCRSLPAWRDSRSMDLTVAPALKHAATTASSHCRMVASASV